MSDRRTPGVHPVPRTHARPRPDLETRRRGKPDSTGARMVIGLAGLATASAITTALLPSILPQPVVANTGTDTAAAGGVAQPTDQPTPSVIHVTHVVQLAPGQSPPVGTDTSVTSGPAAPTARPTPQPTPKIVYQVVTRQSGKP